MFMRFLLALSFLTSLPVSLKKIMTEEDLGKSTVWFPLVGAVIGFCLSSLFVLSCNVWSPFTSGALTVALWVLITRGLHLDGLSDTVDGLGGGFSREKSLEIMKDSRIGAFGALALFVHLALKLSLISSEEFHYIWRLLFIAPVLARWGIVFCVKSFSPARKNGMGRRFTSYCNVRELLGASFIALTFSWFLGGITGIILVGLSGLVAFMVAVRISSSLGGLTGDSYGCICEIVEVFVLLLGVPIFKIIGMTGAIL